MTPIQEWGLAAYYYLSLPLRRHLLARRERQGQAPACVLFYHRVADTHPNPWTIPLSSFRRHLDWLERHTDMVSLPELQKRLTGGGLRRPTVHITFDDGYADNCDHAIPLLLERRIPCTYFVALNPILTGKPFPHDERAGVLLAPNTINQLRAMSHDGFEIGSHSRTHADLGQVHDPAVLHDEIVTASQELADQVGCPIRYFAFPYGQRAQLHPMAMQVARSAGFRGVCSAYGAYNWPGEDEFHIRRIHGDPQFARFRNWLTLDPRKLHQEVADVN
jgi:peptidoglycan/xylan/chitin deacetylase (PgdA/CDA1 family)